MLCCFCALVFLFVSSVYIPKVFSQPIHHVHNLNTGLDYATIQEAIDANETLDGHTIYVEQGTYFENVWLNKSLSLMGQNRNSTIIDGNGNGDVIYVYNANKVNITGFTVQNRGGPFARGISLLDSSGSNISFNVITGNNLGIEVWGSSSSDLLSYNSIFNNSESGISLERDAGSANISHNMIHLNGYTGVHMYYTNNNFLHDNDISSNGIQLSNYGTQVGGYGIQLSGSTNNLISSNNVSENDAGISFESASDHNVLADNTVHNNSKNGIFQSDSFDNNIFNNSISNNQYGICFDTMSTFNSVSNNQVFMNTNGIYIHNSFSNSLSENIVFLNRYDGIKIDSSIDNVLSKNDISGNGEGVQLYSSIGNVVLGNNVSSNSGYGIFSLYASNNTISNNVVSYDDYGIFLDGSKNSDVLNNIVFSNLNFGMCITGSDENTVSGNTIFLNDYGICVWDSSSNVLSSNNVSNNTRGIYFIGYSSSNILKGNTIWENLYGIGLNGATNNIVVHNNFDNIDQFFYNAFGGAVWTIMGPNIWDNRAEGNYWSNYKTKHPNAMEKDHSGIWDTTYVIDDNNIDNCSLVEKWNQMRSFDFPWGQKDFRVTTQSDATIGYIDFNQTNRQISITVTAPMGREEYCNITIPKELLDATADNWTIIHSREIPFIVTSNATHTSLYFTFNYSTISVNVKGTNPIDTVKPHAAAGPDQTVTEGTNVTFDGSTTSDDIATPTELTYIWTFNDTIPQTLSGPSPQYVFKKPGTYEVTLEVTDLRGNSDNSKVTITVLAIPIWNQQWFQSGAVGVTATALVAVLLILRYYRNFKKQRRIVLEYESELETLPVAHPDRARARYIKDDIERREKLAEFQKRYGIKIRPAGNFEDAMNRLGLPKPVARKRV